jgi:hypothetical protein
MTFPVLASDTTEDIVSLAWVATRQLAGSVKEQVTDLRDKSAAQNITATELLVLINDLANARDLLVVRAAENIVAALNSVVAQVDATIALVRPIITVDEQGRLLFKTWDGVAGRTVDVQYSTSDLTALRAQIDTLLATMD